MNKSLLLGITLLISINSFSQTKNFIDQPYVETIAKVDTLIKPDIIYLDILLNEKDERNKISVEELENRMAIKLQGLGINLKEQLTLSDLSSNFKKYFLKQKDVMKSKSYKLKVFDAVTAGRVIVDLEEVGISNVSLDKTEYSKIEELKLDLLSKAMAKAKRQADAMVKPLNQKIGGALHILNEDSQYTNYELQDVIVLGYSSTKKTEFKPVEIEFKPIKVESKVAVKFRIE